MVRLIPVVCVGFLLAAPALAIDESIQIQREYIDRVLTMEDSAAGHVALAKWCESHNLADRARKHWESAVQRDPDNKEARGSLGFVKRGAEWKHVSDAGVAAPAIGPTTVVVEQTSPERRRSIAQDVQAIAIRYLGTTDPASWAIGREQILLFREAAAAEPINRILGVGGVEMRKLACEALGQIPGEEAARYLVKFTLGDVSVDVYKAAVAALASRTADRGVPMLVNALNGSEKALQRAAYALGEMREWRAVPALIGHLKTQEPRVVTYDAPRGSGGSGPSSYFFSGTVVTYIADVTPVVAEGAVGWDPTIGVIPIGSCLRVDNPRVTIHRTIIEVVPQPTVREALTKITGEDREFRSQDYWKLLDKHRAEGGSSTIPSAPAKSPPPEAAPPPPSE